MTLAFAPRQEAFELTAVPLKLQVIQPQLPSTSLLIYNILETYHSGI